MHTNDEEQILQLFYCFEEAGLVEKNIQRALQCFSPKLLGIGLGEQGFVTSLQDVKNVFDSEIKDEDNAVHSVDYKRVEILRPDDHLAWLCAEVQVSSHPWGEETKITRSLFQQSLVMIREAGEWKICGLHASVPTVTEEYLDAFPLRFAEKTLNSLREKIGEEIYLAEEQYRKAVLADAIAFYIINFTTNRFEKCQLQNDTCVYVAPDTPYEQFVIDMSPQYIFEEDREQFFHKFSIHSIQEAFQNGANQVSSKYRMKISDGSYAWTETIIRLIQDVASGDKKGIMYVKNIDEETKAAKIIKEKAEYDSLTKVLNQGTFVQKATALMESGLGAVLLMIDVDNFKAVNDTLGHPTGDKVLIKVGEFLQEMFSEPALVGRLGGDEFGVFLEDEQTDDLMRTRVNLLLDTVRRFRLPEAPQFGFSLSVGVARLEKGSFSELYQTADTMLYQAKGKGKDTAVFSRDFF